MKIRFSKMHGAGNDFIVSDHNYRGQAVSEDAIRRICDRHRGVGADGLIFVMPTTNRDVDTPTDFQMVFFNCDGSRAEMCGNGLRCASLFAGTHLTDQKTIGFQTDAGVLQTEITGDQEVKIELSILRQPEEAHIPEEGNFYFCNTGVPHTVGKVSDIDSVDVAVRGARVRYHSLFAPDGTNVNFIEKCHGNEGDYVRIRTYERGVEGETCACGTGIAAAAISLARFEEMEAPIRFITKDNDELKIEFLLNNNMLSSLTLTGPVVEVFRSETGICC